MLSLKKDYRVSSRHAVAEGTKGLGDEIGGRVLRRIVEEGGRCLAVTTSDTVSEAVTVGAGLSRSALGRASVLGSELYGFIPWEHVSPQIFV